MVPPLNLNNPFFSIIVPVHDVAQYLPACLDSILKQDFSSFELLLIDDGSRDRSWEICNEYSSRDKRIRCMQQSWGGVSKARNLGMGYAHGEWLLFVDADDCLLPGALSIYKNVIAETDADIVKCGYIETRGGKHTEHIISERRIIGNQDTATMLKATEESRYFGFLWNSAFRRSIVGEIRFDETIYWLEDHIFSRQCFGRCRTLVLENRPSYTYYIRERSSLSSVKDPRMMIDAAYKEYCSRIGLLQGEEYKAYEQQESLFYSRVLLASKMAGKLSLQQQVAFWKEKKKLLLRIPGGRMRYLRTVGKLFGEKIRKYGAK